MKCRAVIKILVSLQPLTLPPLHRHGATRTLECNLGPFPLRSILWPNPTLSSTDCWGSLRETEDPCLSTLWTQICSALQLTWGLECIYSKGTYRSDLMWNHSTLMVGNSSFQRTPEIDPEGPLDKAWLRNMLSLKR